MFSSEIYLLHKNICFKGIIKLNNNEHNLAVWMEYLHLLCFAKIKPFSALSTQRDLKIQTWPVRLSPFWQCSWLAELHTKRTMKCCGSGNGA